MYLGLVLKTSAAKAVLFYPSALRENPHPAVSLTASSGSIVFAGRKPASCGWHALEHSPLKNFAPFVRSVGRVSGQET